VGAARGLATIERCGDLESLTAAVPPPEDAEIVASVSEQREVLARIEATQLAGKYQDALSAADALLGESESVGYVPLMAEVQLARGRALQELTKGAEADLALKEAFSLGLRGRSDEVAAEAVSRRVFVLGEYRNRAVEALTLAEVADVIVSRAGDSPRLRWLIDNNHGLVSWQHGDFEAAQRELERAAVFADAHGLGLEFGVSSINLGTLMASLGDASAAASRYRVAQVSFDEVVGPEHPYALHAALAGAQAEWELGQSAAARSTVTRLRKELPGVLGSKNHFSQIAGAQLVEIDVTYRRDEAEALARQLVDESEDGGTDAAKAYRLLGAVLVAHGRHDEGVAAARLASEHTGAGPEVKLTHLFYLGDTLRGAGLLDEAEQDHREALAGFIEGMGEDSPMVAIVREKLAQTLLARGELDEALVEITRACAVLSTPSPPPPRLAIAQRTRGLIEERRGEFSAARRSLAAAVESYERTFDADHPDLAMARFALARVMAKESGGDKSPRALAAARDARAVYEALGSGFAPELAAVDAWLAAP
jgi:tetratricopeptide (TPR) repeat protein